MAVFSLSFSDFWGPKGPRGGRNYLGLKFFWACFGPFPDVLAKKKFRKIFQKKNVSRQKNVHVYGFFAADFSIFDGRAKTYSFD